MKVGQSHFTLYTFSEVLLHIIAGPWGPGGLAAVKSPLSVSPGEGQAEEMGGDADVSGGTAVLWCQEHWTGSSWLWICGFKFDPSF